MDMPSAMPLVSGLTEIGPILQSMSSWWLCLPGRMGGTRWVDIISGQVGALSGIASPPTSTSGWGFGTQPGSYGELRFGGDNDYVEVASPSPRTPDIGAAKTLAFWTQHDGTPAQHQLFFLVKDNTGAANNAVGLDLISSFSVYALRVTNWGAASLALAYFDPPNANIPANTPFHVIYTFTGSGTNHKIYLNGKDWTYSSTSDSQSGFPGIIRFSSFNAVYPSPYHNRPMNDFQIYTRALSAREARQLYEQSRLGYPGLVDNDLWEQVIAQAAAAGGRIWRLAGQGGGLVGPPGGLAA